MTRNKSLKKSFLVVFSEDQLASIKSFADQLDMSASAFIRQSCSRNLRVMQQIDSPTLRNRFLASYQDLDEHGLR
jgi:hypothetical protein